MLSLLRAPATLRPGGSAYVFGCFAEPVGGPSGPEPVLAGRQKLYRHRLQAVLMRQMVLRTMDGLPDELLKNLNVKLPLDKQLALVRRMYWHHITVFRR